MIVPSDKAYKATKLIKQGKDAIKPEFRELATWINNTYDVNTINIIYTAEAKGAATLEIILESISDKAKFDSGNLSNFDKTKQLAIGNQFKKIRTSSGQKTGDVFVFYSAFESVARNEANESITREEIQELKIAIASKDLWEISRSFHTATFFLYTNEQLARYEQNGRKQHWSKLYLHILKQHDEFNYFNESNFSIYLDSKENFDNNYQSNWYYYYK